ncbi:SDR family oxidoreductase [Sphingomonas crocodyli]|uniref:SDR family oxidoreductase n=1 Tax=Sphingomonas crocodyli TaxID=1979270 RepID=A0A437M983_9SPHN|nr:SDR family NAD(P)-dependent oxidoreductase [Sphingomonas crocodyli]RVT94209.1 SDR family oxidoreductase [Sphingomonas crocodyli]
MDLGITGRAAIVTGAGSGIGAAVAARLAAEGALVLLADVNEGGLAEQAGAIRAAGGTCDTIIADVTNAEQVAAMIDRSVSAFGGVGILVNNAGFTRDKRITKMDENDWDAVVDVVLKGAFLCTRAAIPPMADAKWGRIVNISSRAHLGNPGQANYSAAKAGLLGFTRAMSMENGRNGITVNSVAPGLVETAAVTSLPHFPSIQENAAKTTPVGRMGKVEDIADAVAFLASDLAGYISGALLHVTGGRY